MGERVGNLQLPWNHWFHCVGHTYGSWFPGDPRGFRTRGGRQQIVGDYKNPPPAGKYARLNRYAKSIMTRPPVVLSAKQRALCAQFLVESLQRRRFDVVAVSVGSNHFHILARFVDSKVDHWIGVAKKETAHFMKEAGLSPPGGIWAKYGKNQPIKNRQHQLATVRYILNHTKHGSAIWFIGQDKAAGACSRGSPPTAHFPPTSISI